MGCAAEKYDFIAKSFDSDFKETDFNNRIISGWISKYEVDRDGEVVKPTAFEKHLEIYKSNGPLLMFHLHRSLPVGKVVEVKIFPDEGVWASFYITKNPTGDEILTLVREGCLKGFSAGFVPITFEDNPPVYKIPSNVLKTAMGRKVKRQYTEVEWVETSLLPIPSNRSSLIEYAEKGNGVAGLILKSFDIDKFDDLELVIKEWVDANTQKHTLKSLWVEKAFWDESEHPRDNAGQFSDKNKLEYKPTDQKIDEVIHRQKQMQDSLDEIKDKDSWTSFFKKWAVRVGVAVSGYYLFKHRKKSEAYNEVSKRSKEKINEWLSKKAKETVFNSTKGFEHDEEIDKVLSLLDQMEVFLKKGKELGLEEEQEYQNIQRFYNRNYEILKRIAGTESKGLSSLWVVEKQYGLSSLITKEMSKEEFKEEEHPRASDGKFAKKNESSGGSKTESKVEPEISSNVKNVAAGVGAAVVGGVIAGKTGIRVYKNSQIYNKFKESQKIKTVVEDIISACLNPHPNEKALNSIVNMRIVDKVKRKYLMNDYERKLVDYVSDPLQFQKDLAEKFGHLGVEGAPEIRIFTGYHLKFDKPERIMHELITRNQPCYDPINDRININLTFLSRIARRMSPNNKELKYLLNEMDVKTLMLHEYAHSVTMKHDNIAKRHLPSYVKKAESLIGEPIYFEGVPMAGVGKISGKITKVELIEDKMSSLEDEIRQSGFEITPELKKRLDNTYMRKLRFTYKDSYGESIFDSDMLATMSAMAQAKSDASKVFKLDNIDDPREIYGLSNLSEYCSVMVEKGGKL